MKTFMRGVWVIFLLLLFIVIILGSVFFIIKGSKDNKNIVETIKDFFSKDDKETTETSDTQDISQTSTSSGGGGGNGDSTGGGGGGGSSSSEPGCLTTQITYSMINFNRTSVCNQYQEEICVDKTVNCYIEIHNRETAVSGSFKVELRFLEEGKNKEDALDIKTSSFFLEALQYHIFEESTNVQSSGENGTANKRINCFFNTLEVPTKCV